MRRRALAVVLGWVALAQGPSVHAQELPQTVYVWTYGTTSQNIMMASLAGIVNRNTNGEMLLSPIYNSSLPHPVFWLNQLKAAYPEVQSQFQRNPTFFINRYRTMLSGYVLYDRAVNPHSINMATSIAGVSNAIIIEPATLSYATAAGLPLIADARYMTYSQVYAQYGSQFNKNMIFHLDPAKGDTLRDYAIQNKGFVYYTNPTALNPYAANQNHQGRIYGWGPSEYDLFLQASQNNQQIVAGEWSWSASTTSKWKVPLGTQQYHAPANLATQTGKHYVAFVMSDGDNVSSLTGAFATDPKWYGSPYRGNFNMTWDLTSTLGEMNPVAFNYYYQHASNDAHKDSFVSPGGAGSIFPSQYPDIAGLVASISQSMQLADQKVVSILDEWYDTGKLYPILDDPQVMGMMFKACCYYRGRDGALEFYNGKPILSVKYSLWDGADTALSIANALNNSPHRDAINDPASYSIVNVHPWSTSGPDGTGTGTPMGNLNQLVQWIDPSKVEVVTLEELMVHLRNNFGTPLANGPPVQVKRMWSGESLRIPAPLGGLLFAPGGGRLYVVGSSENPDSAVYSVPVTRDPLTSEVLDLGPAEDVVLVYRGNPNTPGLDAGFEFGPEGTLFNTYHPSHAIGQRPGGLEGSETLFSMFGTGVPESVSGLTFTPHYQDPATGFGMMQVSHWFGDGIYDVTLTPLGGGLFQPEAAELFVVLPIAGTGAIQYFPSGPLAGDLLYNNWDNGEVRRIVIDDTTGLPVDAHTKLPTRGTSTPLDFRVASGLGAGPWGLEFDPLTDDFFVSTWEGDPSNTIIRFGTPLANGPPVAMAGADVEVECTSAQGTFFLLDGSASSDPDSSPGTNDDLVAFEWYRDLGLPSETLLGSGETLQLTLPPGEYWITLRVTDSQGEMSTDEVLITIADRTPPAISCPAPVTAECAGPDGTFLNAGLPTASDACAGTSLDFRVDRDPPLPSLGPCPILEPACGTYPLGTTRVTFTATDPSGYSASCTSAVTVSDTMPPVLLASLSETELWPPNHRLVPVSASVAAADVCDPSPAVALVSIASSEPDDAPGPVDGNTLGDIQDASPGTADFDFSLRAERAGTGSERLYTVTYATADVSGNATTATASICVPHDQGGVVEPVIITAEQTP